MDIHELFFGIVFFWGVFWFQMLWRRIHHWIYGPQPLSRCSSSYPFSPPFPSATSPCFQEVQRAHWWIWVVPFQLPWVLLNVPVPGLLRWRCCKRALIYGCMPQVIWQMWFNGKLWWQHLINKQKWPYEFRGTNDYNGYDHHIWSCRMINPKPPITKCFHQT